MAVDYEDRVMRTLWTAAPKAAKYLKQVIDDDELPAKLRYDAATEVLTRLLGKQVFSADTGGSRVEVVFKNEAGEYAK